MIEWNPIFIDDFGLDKGVNPISFIRNRVVNFNESWDMFVSGMRGSAKSSTAASIAMLYNPKFSMKQWAFTTEEWLEATKNGKRGDIVVSDEQGTQQSGSSQSWSKKENKEMADEVQLNRTDGVCTIGISLDSMRVLNRVRDTFKVIIYPADKRADHETCGNGMAVDCIFRFVDENPFADNDKERFNKAYFKYGRGGRITRFRIPHPPADFWNEYSRKRTEFRETVRFAARNKAAPPEPKAQKPRKYTEYDPNTMG